MLTTMHNTVKISQDEQTKPHVMFFYDSTEGGVDVSFLLYQYKGEIKTLDDQRILFLLGTAR